MKRISKYNMKWFMFNNTFVFNYTVGGYKIKHLFGLENIYKPFTFKK